ncbi:MAG: hypothetical protein NTZ56_10295 [Acidobacteria bacterium]|nr:hypothetical protein [Acidobacteriota bacterium]
MFFGIPLTPFNVINFCLIGLIGMVAWFRYAHGHESNVPVLFWGGVVVHMKMFEGGFDYRWVIAGAASALVLRFEFMNRAMARVVQLAESVVLVYLVWRTVGLMLLW